MVQASRLTIGSLCGRRPYGAGIRFDDHWHLERVTDALNRASDPILKRYPFDRDGDVEEEMDNEEEGRVTCPEEYGRYKPEVRLNKVRESS